MENNYTLKLLKELNNFLYKIDYIHTVDNVDIKIPMIYKGASSIMFFFIVPTVNILNFFKNDKVKPVTFLKKWSFVAVNIFKYRKSEVGAFNEFTFSIPVMIGSYKNTSVLPLIFDQFFSSFGFYVVQLGASNDIGRRHIEDIWGYPTYKNNLSIEYNVESNHLSSMIKEGSRNILTISESLPNKKLKFQQKKFKSYFTHESELRQVELNTLLFTKMWKRSNDFKIEFGDHPVSDILKSMGVKKKIFTVYYPYAIEIAGKVKKISLC